MAEPGLCRLNETALNKIGDTVGNTWDIGVGYETGPWGVTVGYMQAEGYAGNGVAGFSQTGNAGALLNGDLKWQEVPVTVKYNLGPGITLNLEAGYAKWTTPDGQSRDTSTASTACWEPRYPSDPSGIGSGKGGFGRPFFVCAATRSGFFARRTKAARPPWRRRQRRCH